MRRNLLNSCLLASTSVSSPRPIVSFGWKNLTANQHSIRFKRAQATELLRISTAEDRGTAFAYHTASFRLAAQPKRGSAVEHYQTVSVLCQSCGERLFRYKKKNGTKSNLVKCYQERIVEDCANVLQLQETSGQGFEEYSDHWKCPTCQTHFARSAMIHGRPALKMIGGKVRMAK